MKLFDDVWNVAIEELMTGRFRPWIIKEIRERMLSENKGAVLEYDFSCAGLNQMPDDDFEQMNYQTFLSYLQKMWYILTKYKFISSTQIDSSRY